MLKCCLCRWDVWPSCRDSLCASSPGTQSLLDLWWCLLLWFVLWCFHVLCFYFYKKLCSETTPVCVHIWATGFLFFRIVVRPHTGVLEGRVLCLKALFSKWLFRGIWKWSGANFYIICDMLINFITRIFTFWNSLQEHCWCICFPSSKDLHSNPYLFFFYKRLQVHQIKLFQKLPLVDGDSIVKALIWQLRPLTFTGPCVVAEGSDTPVCM